ncbi:hypothetical protein F5Y14DRAFT_303015 [Nemania sp. NC0429]|nr:hypothetical protein F5Y14DRAFT_303015 [Nemania sp. NC0429]
MGERSTTASLSFFKLDGHLPSVSHHSNQGCRRHNPTQTPIYHNPCLPPKPGNSFSRLLSRFRHNTQAICRCQETTQNADESLPTYSDPFRKAELRSPFRSQLPLDYQSVATLAPLHPSCRACLTILPFIT